MMDKTGIAHVLDQIASLLELRAENPFRVRAFRSAARTVAALPGDVGAALADGSLAATRGIGPAILDIVTELSATSRSRAYEELRGQVPPGLLEMLSLSGLGVTKVRRIHEHLGIESLADLEEAARSGRLSDVPGFGPRSCENVLRSLAFVRRTAEARLLHHAIREADELRAALERVPGVRRAVVAGDVRRRAEVVHELVLVLVSDAPAAEIVGRLAQVPGVDEFAGQDERRATLRFAGGSVAQVVVTPPVNLGAVLVQATGSRRHVSQLAAHASTLGYVLQGGALWQGSTFVPTPDEDALYRALGLATPSPDTREGVAGLARAGEAPRLLEPGDLRGFLHCHTNFSDGTSSIEDLARACHAAGYDYLGITDHSSSAAYVGGLPVETLERQWAEVDRVNREGPGIRVLKGIEVDILPDGRLDYGPEVLGGFDFVIGSLHDDAGQTEAELTARVLRAMDDPHLAIMGHPTGRQLLSREPYPMDLGRIFRRAAERGIAMEINADPHRLDLDWRRLPEARALGVTISIGADAHSVAGVENMAFGVSMARKGGLGPEAVLNTRPVEEFLRFARARRPG